MDFIVVYGLPIVCLATIAVLLIVYGYKDMKYRKKIEFLTHLVDKGYETENVDINKI